MDEKDENIIIVLHFKHWTKNTKGCSQSVDWYPWILPLINPRLTFRDTGLALHQHRGWHSIDTPSKSCLTVSQQSTNFQSMHISWSTLGSLSTNRWLNVDGVSTKYRSLIKYLSRCQLWVLIKGINWQSIMDAISTHTQHFQ